MDSTSTDGLMMTTFAMVRSDRRDFKVEFKT